MKSLQHFLVLPMVLLFTPIAFSQIDTEFWFAAPEISDNNSNYDLPILLRISTFDAAAEVTISQPANPSFAPMNVSIGPNTTQTVDLSNFIADLENDVPDVVTNKGLQIIATADIQVYYENASLSCLCNPEIFVLKGRNALGNTFFIPYQFGWNNNNIFTPQPSSSFDIVAVEDNTTITITPTQDLVGHPQDIPYSIQLNRGQTYSAKSAFQQGSLHPTGTKVSADRPIAITLKDDLLNNPSYGGCSDLLGDQLIPVDLLGTNYVVVKGFLNGSDIVYIVATENNTAISVGGIPLQTLDEGGSTSIQVVNSNLSFEASAPVYAFHVTGFGCEVGGAVLPPLECTGSQQVSFTRSTGEAFGINIITQAPFINGFTLNGAPLNGADFEAVSFTNDEWYFLSREFTNDEVPMGTANLLSNSDGLFQMAIINGGFTSGCRYGYFSAYNSLLFDLGPDQSICEGQTINLAPNVFLDNPTYLWQDGSNASTFEVSDPGLYWLEVQQEDCSFRDTINFELVDELAFNLPADQSLCGGETFLLTAPLSGDYLWQDGSTGNTFLVESTGVYWLEINQNGCIGRDSIAVDFAAGSFEFSFPADTTLCGNSTLRLSAPVAGDYLWQDGSTLSNFVVEEAGLYWLQITQDGCTRRDSINVDYTEEPFVDLGPDTSLCFGDELVLRAGFPGASYLWQDSSTADTILPLIPGLYEVTVSTACGSAVSEVLIEYINCLEICPIVAPNSFSPNDDGINDLWMIYPPSCTILESNMKIFDRWGSLVFETPNLEEGWDGRIDGEKKGIGVYVWVAEISLLNEFGVTFDVVEKGDILLVR